MDDVTSDIFRGIGVGAKLLADDVILLLRNLGLDELKAEVEAARDRADRSLSCTPKEDK